MIDCLGSFCLVKSRGLAHLVALGPASMVLCYVTVKTVVSVELIGMLRTNCSGETRPALYKAHHEPESVIIITSIKLCYNTKRAKQSRQRHWLHVLANFYTIAANCSRNKVTMMAVLCRPDVIS